jgi:starch phosphorylase
VARQLGDWAEGLQRHWGDVALDPPRPAPDGSRRVTVAASLGAVAPADIRVELYADPAEPDGRPEVVALAPAGPAPGAPGRVLYGGELPPPRPLAHFTARVVPWHPDAVLPAELPLIRWQSQP